MMGVTKLRKTKVPKDRGKLTDLQVAFIHEYVKDFNGSRAAIAAGYSKKTAAVQAAKTLNNPLVAAEVGRIRQSQLDEHKLTRRNILLHLAYCATRMGTDFIDDRGILIEDIRKLPAWANAAIDGIKQRKRRYTNEDGEEVEEVTTEIKLVPKAAAFELAMRHKGLFAADKVQVDSRISIDWDSLFEYANTQTVEGEVISQNIKTITASQEGK